MPVLPRSQSPYKPALVQVTKKSAATSVESSRSIIAVKVFGTINLYITMHNVSEAAYGAARRLKLGISCHVITICIYKVGYSLAIPYQALLTTLLKRKTPATDLDPRRLKS